MSCRNFSTRKGREGKEKLEDKINSFVESKFHSLKDFNTRLPVFCSHWAFTITQNLEASGCLRPQKSCQEQVRTNLQGIAHGPLRWRCLSWK